MSERVNQISSVRDPRNEGRTGGLSRGVRYAALLSLLGSLSLVAGFEAARKTLPDQNLDGSLTARSASRALSTVHMPKIAKSGDAELNRLPPQQQAERLLERAMQNDAASLDLLQEKVDGWRGRLKNTDQLFDLVLAALNSRDLRVRTVAVDVDLAANNLSKSPESVTRLIQQLRRDPATRGMALWRLGSLGNRGVEPELVLSSLLNYA
ncbi:MAG: hypothetical protein WA817_17810, partial [Candidatus Acidiferrum sp.]